LSRLQSRPNASALHRRISCRHHVHGTAHPSAISWKASRKAFCNHFKLCPRSGLRTSRDYLEDVQSRGEGAHDVSQKVAISLSSSRLLNCPSSLGMPSYKGQPKGPTVKRPVPFSKTRRVPCLLLCKHGTPYLHIHAMQYRRLVPRRQSSLHPDALLRVYHQ
jgi:hypothetical protein